MRNFLNPDPPDISDIEDALINFGWYHSKSQLCRMYAAYQNHGHYGYSGGLIDQPDIYWHDMDMMRWLELWITHVSPVAGQAEDRSIFDKLASGGSI